ncbi:MAG: LacI family DNA-binding transcriptional regulator [Actinomycetota bacterium]
MSGSAAVRDAAPARRGSQRQGHPTILDVAERAGVSKSLVSLALRGSPRVREEKRKAILRAAEQLGYRPNAVARSLVRKRTNVIGVMLSDLHNLYFAEVVDGIEAEALSAQYRALINTGSRMAEREWEAIETLLQLRTDGLILAGPVLPASLILSAASSVPVVLVARASRWPSVDSVTNDDRAGARMAVDHLVSLGHRDIAHVDGGTGAGSASRRSGYLEAMRDHGLARAAVVAPGAFTEEGGAAGIDRLLASKARPTAVFVANDLAAVGALHALERQGARVPDDVSVVGYDNTALAALGHIELTTIDQPRREIGAMAVRLLLERLDDGRDRGRHVVLTPRLVVGGTTRPPRGRVVASTRALR